MKIYALRYLKDENSLWSDVVAVSHEIPKLTALIMTTNSYTVGSYDQFNSPKVVRFTDVKVYPRYMIEEIPYVV